MRSLLAVVAIIGLGSPSAGQAGGAFTVAATGRSYATLEEAVAALEQRDGTIRIRAGRYRDCAIQTGGRVRFEAAQPGSVVFDGGICEDKATLVLRGTATEIDGIVFRHTVVPDGNGAGIRIEQGDLKVTNCMFLDGQSGILSARDPRATISIDHSTFSGLGKDPTGNGAHGIYVGEYAALVITRSRFERGTGGHYVKTRAPRVSITDSSFDDTGGFDTNYMIDLSEGATGLIARNSFVVGPNKQNYSTMITVAPESTVNKSAGLIVENNDARLAPGFRWSTTLVGDWSGERLIVRNNKLTGRITEFGTRRSSAAYHGARTLAANTYHSVKSVFGY